MNTNVVNALALTGAAAAGGAKLVIVGACLAVGFSIGNFAVHKTSRALQGWRYSRLEKQHKPPEEDNDNGGLSSKSTRQEEGS